MQFNSFHTIPADAKFCFDYLSCVFTIAPAPDKPEYEVLESYSFGVGVDDRKGDLFVGRLVRLISACGLTLIISKFALDIFTNQMNFSKFIASAVYSLVFNDGYVASNNFANYYQQYCTEWTQYLDTRGDRIKQRVDSESIFDTETDKDIITKKVSERLDQEAYERLRDGAINTIFKSTFSKAFVDFMDNCLPIN